MVSFAPFREWIKARTETPDPADKAVGNYGGWFCNLGHPDDVENWLYGTPAGPWVPAKRAP